MHQTSINNDLREKIITACVTSNPNSITAVTHSNLLKSAKLYVVKENKQFVHLFL